MSTTETRLSYDEAVFHAISFRDLFDPSTYQRWEFAGSVRRGKEADIGDIEHVVIPTIADVPGKDMFATPAPVNLLLRRMDELAAKVQIVRHNYNGKPRWGNKYRGCDFNTLGTTALHEVFCADADNWGPTMAIRTGPGDFSRRLVSGLHRLGRRNHLGYVWRCERCDCPRNGDPCKLCDGTSLKPVEKISAPTEEGYFELCGIPFIPPEERR